MSWESHEAVTENERLTGVNVNRNRNRFSDFKYLGQDLREKTVASSKPPS